MSDSPRRHRVLLAIFAVALLLRLAYGLSQDHDAVFSAGNDSAWYLQNGIWMVTNDLPGPPTTAPLYLLFIGAWQRLLSPDGSAIVAIRICQAILSTLTCFFAYRLAWSASGERRAGLLAAAALAVAPVFIIEAAQVLTETLYIFFVMAALWLYVDFAAPPAAPDRTPWRALVAAGIVFGLATLTRAIPLLFPFGLLIHLLLLRGWRRGLVQAAALIAPFVLVVSTWTIYNLVAWDTFVIGGDGFASFLYIGAREWEGPEATDQQLAEDVPELSPDELTNPDRDDVFLTGAQRAISEDPVGYVTRRVKQLASAYLQPHGTTFFDGPSLKDMARDWLTDDRSLNGLRDLISGQGFWPKLALYLFHYTALVAGAAGMWITRRRWRSTLPLLGFALYTTLVHLFLLALPRYLFPAEPVWWIFAAAALVALWDWAASRRVSARQTAGSAA
ncbi:MAG TPA: glycosyltransferase family 39 protein [Aggregatilinea sp.]|uniref:ArnT family glycosyltransferase n=1 Tax=Aggregatilinea sp. TaxID=2806333 RepID=UPI002C756ECD|nr:glycosyltransferase family 39 protein [Aggregatilinea sp.]HML21023.1 glycosyltransferase family 39 protein [Aggregatilinea sp.]